jgi:membrane-associated phospholipid phosphatase
MAHFFPANASQFRTWAEEAAMSRIYGGIHYQFDADAGLDQGRKSAAYSVARAKQDGVD